MSTKSNNNNDGITSSSRQQHAQAAEAESIVNQLQDVIGTDAGGRGMKHLIVPNDLVQASRILSSLPAANQKSSSSSLAVGVLILSGFPCCVKHNPPTETDGPPGAIALARVVTQLGHAATIVTEDGTNAKVFQAALDDTNIENCTIEAISTTAVENNKEEKNVHERLLQLAQNCQLILSCERAGPAHDGNCYTMRGINMNEKGLIAPIHKLVEYISTSRDDDDGNNNKIYFLAIGDGGNELGMGKVLDRIHQHIPRGNQIGCTVAADYLIAASVSNWGAYALAAGAAVMRAAAAVSDDDDDDDCNDDNCSSSFLVRRKYWVTKCLPTEQQEIDLLHRCIAKGCRDGVSGKIEATVDGMPLERSLQCLRDIIKIATSSSQQNN